MCGRSRCALAPEDVPSTAGVPPQRWQQQEHYSPDENVAPGHSTPVLKLAQDGKPELHTMVSWAWLQLETTSLRPAYHRLVLAEMGPGAELHKEGRQAGSLPHGAHCSCCPAGMARQAHAGTLP